MGDIVGWLQAFVSEKDLDLEHRFEIDGPGGMLNSIPLSNVITAIGRASSTEQQKIRNQLAIRDFRNEDVMIYFEHLAGALAV
ncbi:MAG: hypothetical protein PHQ28_00555 [Mycobacterium sp.]|nr:hypothetical protein [Mycobacterium sp.]